MNKKGFTLVELLGILIILGIVLAITVPTIGNVISKSYMKAYEINLKSIEDASKSYVLKKNIKMEHGIPGRIEISELVDERLIDPIIDPKTKEKCTGYVTVISYNESYTFSPCLKCGTNYESDNCNKTDYVIPTITLLGDNPVNIFVGKIYSDAGAIAFDDVNGDITDKIKVSGHINPDIPGVYTLSYDVSDSEGNAALTVTRTINVIDNVDPVITFNPNGNTTYAKNRSAQVNVIDINSGIKTNSLKYLWSTSTSTPNKEEFTNAFTNGESINSLVGVTGSYYLWATATDISNNKVTTRSNVFNLDNEKPVITINGNSSVTINKGTAYSDAGATATDNIDTTVTVIATGSVNPNVIGTYTITYNATDSSGNVATPVTRTINVIDVKAPVITILGSNPATVSGGGTYNDAGATAVDDVDGDVTSKITTTSTVNTNKLGTYTVTYKVTDNAGNTATSSRIVNVVDNILPTVTGAIVPTNWTSGNKTITVTGTDTGLSGIAGYYIGASSTKPTTASAWTASTSTTWTVSRGAGTYYIWIKDGAGNISSTYKSITVTNIDGNAPTVTAKGSSYTITEGVSNVISSTYFNISENGNAPISSTTCVDTSKSNAVVTNTSTLTVGTHVIRCTVKKANGLSTNAQTSIVVSPAYTGIGSGIYQPGQVVSYAGIQWNVIEDYGASVTLITKEILNASQIASHAPQGFFKDDRMGHCARAKDAPEHKLYCFSSSDSYRESYKWGLSAIKKTVESWLNNNSTLIQAKNDGGLVNMSFSDGISNYNGYVRIITYNEALDAYSAGNTWHFNPDFEIMTLTSTGGAIANGSNLVYGVETDGSVISIYATISFYWYGDGALVRPVIQVKK